MNEDSPKTPIPHVVVIGGGFAGLSVARSLRRAPVRVTLVDRRNFHLFQPLLYQVATGSLSPANIAGPLRGILRRQRNAEVLLGEVVDFDVAGQRVVLADGELAYDTLVLATGSRHSYFGHDEFERFAPGLKTIEDATAIRSKLLFAFEAAERAASPEERRAWLTFVIVGGGPTGVELAGALGEIAHRTLRNDFRHIDPSEATILVVDAAERILGMYPADLVEKAQHSLEHRGVTVRTGAIVTDVAADHVVFKCGDEHERIETRTVIWAAGVQASPLAKRLAERTGLKPDRSGRIGVEPDLSLPGHPEVFAVGDLALVIGSNGKPLPGLAPVAMQEGKYVAKRIGDRLRRRETAPFAYRDPGSMATIGRYAAIAQFGRRSVSGFTAWCLWLAVHVLQITQLENRILVAMQWAWSFLTFNRSARLITHADPNETVAPNAAGVGPLEKD